MRYLIALGLGLMLAACGTMLEGPTPIPIFVPMPTATTIFAHVPPTPTSLASVGAGDTVVSYERTGCFGGVKDRLTVYGDGRIEYSNRLGELRSGMASLEQIRDLELKLKVVVGVSAPQFPAPADACVYSFRAALADGTLVEVTTSDGAQHPQVIVDVVDALEELRLQTS
jgi:hypothetical protein